MSTPAYSHTYTYNRVGAGDVVALDPAGYPYFAQAEVPSGWNVNYWYSTDPLATPRATSAWIQWGGVGVPPIDAVRLLVNVISATRTPESARLKYNVATDNYKAATGLRYTDSGSHAVSLSGTESSAIPFLSDTPVWFDFTGVSPTPFRSETCWKNILKRDPGDRSTAGDSIHVIDNKGFLGGDIVDAANQTRWLNNKLGADPRQGGLEAVGDAFIASSALGTWNIPTYHFEQSKGFSTFWVAAPDAPISADNPFLFRDSDNVIQALIGLGGGDTWRQNGGAFNTDSLVVGVADQFVWGLRAHGPTTARTVGHVVASGPEDPPVDFGAAFPGFTLGGGSTLMEIGEENGFLAEFALINRFIWDDRQDYIDYAVAKYGQVTFP